MNIRTSSIDFSSPLRGSGPRTASKAVVFPRTVRSAAVGITGYSLGYASSDDHHVGRLELTTRETINDNVVTVDAALGVRDWSGDWDDNYQGSVQFVVLADLEPLGTVPPRRDLQITDFELNQAVQFFRASSYLDGSHALPDNSVAMIARKNTGVRVYVDYDASAGLPPVSSLTGSLEVTTATNTLTLSPINGSITPRPESTINMAVANHTLNFSIPAVWCEGTLTLRCQVWDAADPSKKSAAFTRTLTFTDVAPLNIYVVGITYTAESPTRPAPTQAEVTSQMLPALIKTYPVGDVVQSGYSSIEFGEVVTGTLSGGCTDGFNDLLDRLSDLRGGSSDIYVGVLPPGIQSLPGNQIGGCGDSGLAACFLDLPQDLPHEVGHAFGRQHAPCSPSGRCSPSPANVDGSYPQYGTFPSDSIGVFGFDAATNTVFNPSETFDFMAYSFPQWVSAYTYLALRGAFAATSGPGGGGVGGANHLQDRQAEYLHLGLEIARDRTVRRVPSFHHPGHGVGGPRCGEFTLELLDEEGKVLICAPLSCGCGRGGCQCWPRHVRDTIPWPPGVRTLVVWEGEKQLYEEDVPDPPKVRITSVEAQKDRAEIKWQVSGEGAESDDLWCIVHWYDPVARVWRGVAPRQRDHSAVVPARLFRHGQLCVRVLATSGLATGFAQRELELDGYEPSPTRPRVEMVELGPTGGGPAAVLRAVLFDEAGREVRGADVAWYDAGGAEISRGSELDTRTLEPGAQVVRAVALHGDGFAAKGWHLSPGREGAEILHEVPEPGARPKEMHVHPHPRPKQPKPKGGPCPPEGEDAEHDHHPEGEEEK